MQENLVIPITCPETLQDKKVQKMAIDDCPQIQTCWRHEISPWNMAKMVTFRFYYSRQLMVSVLVTFLIPVTKYLTRRSLRRNGFILGYRSRGVQSAMVGKEWWLKPDVGWWHSLAARKQKVNRKVGPTGKSWGLPLCSWPTSRKTLSLKRFYSLPKPCHPLGIKCLNHEPVRGGEFHF